MELGFPHWREVHFTAFHLLSPRLNRLRFDRLNITSDDLRAAILHAPSLTHLEIISCHDCFDDAFISALHYKDGVTPLAPRLHHLMFDGRGRYFKFTEDILADMIISRWWTDAQLASPLPVVARWTRVGLWGLDQHFYDMLKELPSNVVIVR
ncbi:hypothetical protein K438DRAFT_1812282 [Mycena galopus ATCC 62051]|nr:hypothetical protein K438DRAFT_1812282 [Mycena galopus ATCC 62051]